MQRIVLSLFVCARAAFVPAGRCEPRKLTVVSVGFACHSRLGRTPLTSLARLMPFAGTHCSIGVSQARRPAVVHDRAAAAVAETACPARCCACLCSRIFTPPLRYPNACSFLQATLFNDGDLEGLFTLYDPKSTGAITAGNALSALAQVGLDSTRVHLPADSLNLAAFIKVAQAALLDQKSL